jgi:hypothetical protein
MNEEASDALKEDADYRDVPNPLKRQEGPALLGVAAIEHICNQKAELVPAAMGQLLLDQRVRFQRPL